MNENVRIGHRVLIILLEWTSRDHTMLKYRQLAEQL